MPGFNENLGCARDQNGTVAKATTSIIVVSPLSHYGIANFAGNIESLFVSVVEGIAEVAAVALPLAAAGAAVVVPIRRRGKSQKTIRPS